MHENLFKTTDSHILPLTTVLSPSPMFETL